MGGAQEGKGQLEKIRANMCRKTVKIRPKKQRAILHAQGKQPPQVPEGNRMEFV